MSVAMSQPSLYSRRQATLAGKLKKQSLPRLAKSYPAERAASATTGGSSSLQSQEKTGSSLSTTMSSAVQTRPHNVSSGSSVDTITASGSSRRSGVTKGNVFSSYYPFRKAAPSRISCASSVMDEKYRESLQRHYRLLLTQNLLTDDVIKKLGDEKILPDSMIKDIQEAETREEKNECLLKCLHLRGNRCYRRFRELMYRTGNFFVADLLWDEGEGTGTLEEADLVQFPGLLGCVPEPHRKRLVHFLEAKVRERALLLAWKTSPEERMEALGDKVRDFQQEKTFKDTIAMQEKKIQDLESSLQAETENCRALRLELSSQRQHLQQVRKDHLSTLEVQSRFHDANLSTITRLKERLSKCKEGVKTLNDGIKRRLEVGNPSSDMGGEGDEGAVDDEPKLDALEYHVRKLIFELKHERDRANKLEEQRQEVLKLLNHRYTKDPLVSVVKEVLRQEQKHRSLVMRDILRLAHSLKQLTPGSNLTTISSHATRLPDTSMLETKHFKTQLAILKAEIEHIHKRLQWKDSEISDRQKEIHFLKQRLGEYPPMSSPSPPAPFSSSQQSLDQPFHTPVDSIILQEDHLQLSRASQISNFSVTSTPPSSHRTSLTPCPEGSRSPKTVTFEEQDSGRKPHGRSRGASARERARPDPDKTLVIAESYLLEESSKAPEEEVGEDIQGVCTAPRPAPSRGEGDINGNQGRGNSGQ